MQIGSVAKKVGLTVDAIRFYERNALMPRPARTQGGFRQYGQRDIETLAFIRRVQGLGFQIKRNSGSREVARKADAAVRTGPPPLTNKAG
jgi:DNA-binding transcriptional MerR regulator